jgi:hypothetical protein
MRRPGTDWCVRFRGHDLAGRVGAWPTPHCQAVLVRLPPLRRLAARYQPPGHRGQLPAARFPRVVGTCGEPGRARGGTMRAARTSAGRCGRLLRRTAAEAHSPPRRHRPASHDHHALACTFSRQRARGRCRPQAGADRRPRHAPLNGTGAALLKTRESAHLPGPSESSTGANVSRHLTRWRYVLSFPELLNTLCG